MKEEAEKYLKKHISKIQNACGNVIAPTCIIISILLIAMQFSHVLFPNNTFHRFYILSERLLCLGHNFLFVGMCAYLISKKTMLSKVLVLLICVVIYYLHLMCVCG